MAQIIDEKSQRCYECYIINKNTGEHHPDCSILRALIDFGETECYNLPVIQHDVQKWQAGERSVIGAVGTINLLAEAGHIDPGKFK